MEIQPPSTAAKKNASPPSPLLVIDPDAAPVLVPVVETTEPAELDVKTLRKNPPSGNPQMAVSHNNINNNNHSFSSKTFLWTPHDASNRMNLRAGGMLHSHPSASSMSAAYATFQDGLSELSQQQLLHNSLLRVGIIMETITDEVFMASPQESAFIEAIGSPISNCCVTAFVIIEQSQQQQQQNETIASEEEGEGSRSSVDDVSSSRHSGTNLARQQQEATARAWLDQSGCSRSPDKVRILYGHTGYKVVLDHPTLVDAIFVLTGASTQHQYVMRALKAKKHVLFYDRVSQPLEEFQEQLRWAFKVGRFLQSSTMFVHHHRVKVFLACVNNQATFGNLQSIHAKLLVNYDDAARIMGVEFPLVKKGDGCVRRLGRYCVLISVLLLSRAGSQPVSASVEPQYEDEDDVEPTSAKGTVHFTDDRVVTFEVGYSSIPTRQVLEVHAPTRYATMTDFVLPHRDGLATYRVYHKDVEPLSGKLEVVRAESLDVMSGPPQDIMMWRDFSLLCDAVERYGYGSPQAQGSRELANVANCTKKVLLALEESIETRKQVPVVIEDLGV